MSRSSTKEEHSQNKKEPRIRVREVLAAYAKTGLHPCTGTIYTRVAPHVDEKPGEVYACALGALAVRALGAEGSDSRGFWRWVEEKYGAEYVAGFWRGFDAVNEEARGEEEMSRRQGREDGEKVRKALQQRGLLR